MDNCILEKLKMLSALLVKYRLLIFLIAALAYLELVYRLWNFHNIGLDYIFPVLFSLSAGGVLFIISGLFPARVNRILAVSLTLLLSIGYSIQLIYHCIFHTPLSIYSLNAADDVLQFKGIIISSVFKNAIAVFLLFVPFIYIVVTGSKFLFSRIKPVPLCITLFFCIASYAVSIVCVNLTDGNSLSQYTLYYKVASPELSVNRLGLLTTMRLDFKRLVFGFRQYDTVEEAANDNEDAGDNYSTAVSCFADAAATSGSGDTGKAGIASPAPESTAVEIGPAEIFNTMNIDFEALMAKEKDEDLLGMHKYFSSVKPTKRNKYTGIFKGNNLILITAESFSPYVISQEFTPTLYKMSREGFVFSNFYNPVWGVSTSDGEYVACTGLLPKSGIWSFARSGKNYMPFVMGNQFKKLGYTTKAYHNHSYKYYKRNISHPNMGYDYKGVGNGLKVKKTWPESDLEMIEVTAGEYIGPKPFHTYYMTVSGHMQYSFSGNYIAKKNKPFVEKLPFSNASKAYIACNMELEFAIKALVDKLEAAGIADKTVIAISADHYPYGLPRECIDELAGHEVENNFELYKSTFILWKKGMSPILIDKPCSSLDIIPTLSNLFGLEYDSRLLMGSDILSDTPPVVIFSNWSWITDRARFNAVTNTITYVKGTDQDTDHVKAVNKAIEAKFKYSAKILEKDYYSRVITGASKK